MTCAAIRALPLLSLALLAGCAHQRETVARGCPLRMLPVDVDAARKSANDVAVESAALPPSYAVEVRQRLKAAAAVESSLVAENLVLSGGGKWGAFGAGFLRAWPGRPNFTVVTGVSTGALQSSFVFLGDQRVPADPSGKRYDPARDLALLPGDPQPGLDRRYIDDLTRAYDVTRSGTILKQLGDETTALREGAAADLAPLRVRLDALVDDHVMEQVGLAGRLRRALYVGVVDMDDGHAYAVDMTDLGQRWLAAGAPGAGGHVEQERLRDCYLDVLVAASSEPLAAFPVFIRTTSEGQRPGAARRQPFETRMLMDAGIRNGVFLQEVLKPDGSPEISAPKFNTTVIVNGDLAVADLTDPPDPKWGKEWSLLSLVKRTKDLLVDQIYQLTVSRVLGFGTDSGAVRLATAAGYKDFQPSGSTQKCPAIRDEEKGLGFPPRFMRCLIAYGESRWQPGQRTWDHEALK